MSQERRSQNDINRLWTSMDWDNYSSPPMLPPPKRTKQEAEQLDMFGPQLVGAINQPDVGTTDVAVTHQGDAKVEKTEENEYAQNHIGTHGFTASVQDDGTVKGQYTFVKTNTNKFYSQPFEYKSKDEFESAFGLRSENAQHYSGSVTRGSFGPALDDGLHNRAYDKNWNPVDAGSGLVHFAGADVAEWAYHAREEIFGPKEQETPETSAEQSAKSNFEPKSSSESSPAPEPIKQSADQPKDTHKTVPLKQDSVTFRAGLGGPREPQKKRGEYDNTKAVDFLRQKYGVGVYRTDDSKSQQSALSSVAFEYSGPQTSKSDAERPQPPAQNSSPNSPFRIINNAPPSDGSPPPVTAKSMQGASEFAGFGAAIDANQEQLFAVIDRMAQQLNNHTARLKIIDAVLERSL